MLSNKKQALRINPSVLSEISVGQRVTLDGQEWDVKQVVQPPTGKTGGHKLALERVGDGCTIEVCHDSDGCLCDCVDGNFITGLPPTNQARRVTDGC